VIRDFSIDFAVVQNGFWRAEIDLAHPRFVSLRADPAGLAHYSQEMLRDVIAQWRKNHLSCTPMLDWCRPQPDKLPNPRLRYTGGNAWTWIDGQGATGAGTEPYLSDGGAMIWAVYAGILGIRPDFQGVSFVPHVPEALADTEVAVRLMGRRLAIRFHGSGDFLRAVRLNGRIAAGGRLLWTELREGATVDVDVGRAPVERTEERR
jgi:hypothetical protein